MLILRVLFFWTKALTLDMIIIKIVQLSTEKEHEKLASNFDFRNENKTEHAFKSA